MQQDIGVAIHGRSFATRAVPDNLARSYRSRVPRLFNVGLLHTCDDGREGHEPYAPCSLLRAGVRRLRSLLDQVGPLLFERLLGRAESADV